MNTPFYFAFRHYSNDQYILGLDNIKVTTNDLASREEISQSGLIIYPNPSHGIINIKRTNDIELFKIFNSLGEIIWNGKIVDYNQINLNSGIYYLETKKGTSPIIVY